MRNATMGNVGTQTWKVVSGTCLDGLLFLGDKFRICTSYDSSYFGEMRPQRQRGRLKSSAAVAKNATPVTVCANGGYTIQVPYRQLPLPTNSVSQCCKVVNSGRQVLSANGGILSPQW